MSDQPHPIEGQIVLLAGAKSSVTLDRLSDLLEEVQSHLAKSRSEYERQFECIEGTDTEYYLAGVDHWGTVAAELGLNSRERDAVRRAHEAQFRRDGRRLDREEEFETTLAIRCPVVIA